MKVILSVIAFFFILSPLSAQSHLDAPEMEQTLTPEEFSDAVKEVWDVVKKSVDEYHDDAISRTEFETAADFEARLQERHNDLAGKIQTFVASKKIADRVFAVLMPARLVKYNADTQTYSITTSARILVPPTALNIVTTCPQNSYIALTEKDQRGYKFAYLILNTKPEYTWHVDKVTAQKAKSREDNVFFKVWFRLDLSQAFVSSQGQVTVVPMKIALVDKGENITYWSDDIIK